MLYHITCFKICNMAPHSRGGYTTCNASMSATWYPILMEVIPYRMIACVTHDIPFPWRLYHITYLHGCHVVPNSHGGYTTSHVSMGDTWHHIPIAVIPNHTLTWVAHSTPFPWSLYHMTCLYVCHMTSHSHGGYTTLYAPMCAT